jgi:hypothetical protein
MRRGKNAIASSEKKQLLILDEHCNFIGAINACGGSGDPGGRVLFTRSTLEC